MPRRDAKISLAGRGEFRDLRLTKSFVLFNAYSNE